MLRGNDPELEDEEKLRQLRHRELEAGTQRLAWVQSVTRTRWLGVKLAVIGAVGVGLTALMSLAITWWSGAGMLCRVASSVVDGGAS